MARNTQTVDMDITEMEVHEASKAPRLHSTRELSQKYRAIVKQVAEGKAVSFRIPVAIGVNQNLKLVSSRRNIAWEKARGSLAYHAKRLGLMIHVQRDPYDSELYWAMPNKTKPLSKNTLRGVSEVSVPEKEDSLD